MAQRKGLPRHPPRTCEKYTCQCMGHAWMHAHANWPACRRNDGSGRNATCNTLPAGALLGRLNRQAKMQLYRWYVAFFFQIHADHFTLQFNLLKTVYICNLMLYFGFYKFHNFGPNLINRILPKFVFQFFNCKFSYHCQRMDFNFKSVDIKHTQDMI